MIEGIIRDFKPEAVKKPLVHQPISTTSPLPKVGSQRNMTPKNKISRIPIKNVGNDTPTSEIVMNVLERKPYRLSAV